MLAFISSLAALATSLLGLFKKTPQKKEQDADKEVDEETAKEDQTGRPDPKFFGDRGL